LRCSLLRVCRIFGLTRQAFYKARKTRSLELFEENKIVQETRRIRRDQPRVGTRKIYRTLLQMGIQIGRDRLFEILRNHKMLIKKRKRYTKTTNSYHRFRKHRNLIKDLTATKPNQVFVSDITYLDTKEGFCYLALVTDLYSRKIVGWDVSKSLSVEGCQRALRMALKGIQPGSGLIHHSDRGIQYCTPRYTAILENHGVQISMTEENHAYENAVAERVNGILKDEFLLGERLPSFHFATQLVPSSIKTYNNLRLHLSLHYKTPAQCYAV
jgi:putative transposase